MSPDWANPLQHMWLFGATSTHQSVDFLIDRGVAAWSSPYQVVGSVTNTALFLHKKCDSKNRKKQD